MRSVLLRPKWIALFLVALAVAAGLAALGRWQIGRAFENGEQHPKERATVSLGSVAKPQEGVREASVGRSVRMAGQYSPDDVSVVTNRTEKDRHGYWVVAAFRVVNANPASGEAAAAPDVYPQDDLDRAPTLAVTLGFTESRTEADRVATAWKSNAHRPQILEGTYELPNDPDVNPHGVDPTEIRQMSTAILANVWHGGDGWYQGFVIAGKADAGLDRITPIAPTDPDVVNWLNVFYAAEWVLFAGFAIFMWYRLARDEYERELEDAAERAAADREKLD